MNTIEEIADVLKQAKSAVIFTHMRPDGDTLGSGMALSRALTLCKIPNEVVNEGEIPQRFLFLKGTEKIVRRPTLRADVYIAVDTSALPRLGLLEETFRAGSRRRITVNVDHHVSNTRFAQYNYVRERASNCENILELILALKVPLDGEIANGLMLGMVTDSGGFSHSDVKGDTLRAAAVAADAGADLHRITYETMQRRSKARAGLYAEAVAALRYFNGDTLAVAVVTQDMLRRYGLDSDATEGVVDFALTVDCVEVSASLLEVKKGQYKVSFRSKGKVNVNEVAGRFGGGGHVLASGCMIFGDLEDVLDRVRYAVWQHMGEA